MAAILCTPLFTLNPDWTRMRCGEACSAATAFGLPCMRLACTAGLHAVAHGRLEPLVVHACGVWGMWEMCGRRLQRSVAGPPWHPHQGLVGANRAEEEFHKCHAGVTGVAASWRFEAVRHAACSMLLR